ncbi:MAG: flagellar basal body L-ring protein FlgH [Rhodobacteraceae bacterium]|uniref:flagellar basal body L-ring protein FlgH n=1 Tax=Celeribacter sp. HF31 TaxID=2721558 RepID=UPI00142FB49A|nr:flagellar basal body L-ring protein FlgH [Celeribacter sp. HF31]NIY79317.1 flagellar basal body L-ring protein FlgH [Celeribacter sp. HF31]NVK45743.1 flagellar basal body L-ring protein FlgH [Paracoccaceae bacterium]
MRLHLLLPAFLALSACSDLKEVGRLPEFTPIESSSETAAMRNPTLPDQIAPRSPADGASLWNASRQSLLGDRRAIERGDILTVVIEIDDSAEMSNTSKRGRSGSETMGISSLFGLPERINEVLPDGASMGSAVGTNSNSSSSGNGSVKRNEKLELMIAATIVDVLPNGVLHIQGTQEVRVNFEIRELLVEGYVRPEDISRQNEITYDKIASARISYGGRGQITQVQQPRYGQQVADIVLPF